MITGNHIYDYQTLLAGILAIVGASIAAFAVWRSTRLTIERDQAHRADKDQRRLSVGVQTLSADLQTLSRRAAQALGTINVHIAANASMNDSTRSRTILAAPPSIEDWELMSLFPAELIRELVSLRHAVEAHNFDMERAGGAFGDDNFQRHVKKQADSIRSQATSLAQRVQGTSVQA